MKTISSRSFSSYSSSPSSSQSASLMSTRIPGRLKVSYYSEYKGTHTPSPSMNISSRSLTRLSFIQAMRNRTSAGRPSGAVFGMQTVCLGFWEKMRCRPPLHCQLLWSIPTARQHQNVPKLDLDLEVISALTLRRLGESLDGSLIWFGVTQSVRSSNRCCRHGGHWL